jgi:hypothetical protein
LLFLCQQFQQRGISLGCSINPDKTRILTSSNGTSPIQSISTTNPNLAHEITTAISTYTTKPVKLTDRIRLLGLPVPVGNDNFTIEFLNNQLEVIQKQTATLHKVIKDPQTCLRLFQQCTSMKLSLSHLLITNTLHNLDANTIYTDEMIFTGYQGPFTTSINKVKSNFIADLTNYPDTLPTYALQIAQLSISNRGLGFYNPSSRALTDLVNNYIVSRRNVIQGIRTHKDLPLRL